MKLDGSGEQPTRRLQGSDELLETMREQERLCMRLLEVSEQEREAMLEGQVDVLETATRLKESLIAEMGRLEQLRRTLAKQLAEQLWLPADSSLLGLAAAMRGEEAAALVAVRQRVVDTVARVRETNDGNLLLMRKSLDLIKERIRHLRRVAWPGEVYTSDGRPVVDVRNTAVVDCRG